MWKVPENNKLLHSFKNSFLNTTLSNFINCLEKYVLCPGISKEDSCSINRSFIQHPVPKIFLPFPLNDLPSSLSSSSSSFPLHQTIFFRSQSCSVLLDASQTSSSTKCQSCTSLLKKETLSLKRKLSKDAEPAKLNAPIQFTSPDRIKLTLQSYRIENKSLKEEMQLLKEQIDSNNIVVDDKMNSDLVSIIQNTNNLPPFMKFFWEEQQKYIKCNKKGIRYHPAIIRYCLNLQAKSSSMYEEIRYDEKTGTGFLVLPSKRRLRDYKNYIRPQRGFNPDIIKELADKTSNFSDQEKYVTILIDEMKIQEDLVWDKHTGELIGYVDLGDKEVNQATLKDTQAVASHILVFLVRSIVNPFKFSLANFAIKCVTSVQLFPLFWQAVGILEDRCNIKVIAVTSDGASSNRSFYKMHSKMERVGIAGTDAVVYKTENLFADDGRDIFFICDQPHALKCARNNFYHSGFGSRSSRLMWNNGQYIIWDHISKLMIEDLDCSLQLCPKITSEHIHLTPFSCMNVRLAVQVLSQSVSTALSTYGPPESQGSAKYCELFDKFFDCMNVRNTKETTYDRKPFLAPYRSINDERFTWLTETFLNYFSEWKKSVEGREGNFTTSDRSRMFIAWQTNEALQITTHSVINLVKYLLQHGVQYVLTERLCQDPLENYFGRQRSLGNRQDNPNLRSFGYQDNAIPNSKVFKPIQGGNSQDIVQPIEISTEPISCRPRFALYTNCFSKF